MSKAHNNDHANRRRFERIEVDYHAQVKVLDKKNKSAGILRQLSRGGMMLEPEREFKPGKKEELTIIDESEKIKVKLKCIVRYGDMRRVGFEFEDLDANSAVEIGILIGKYYHRETADV